MAIFKGIKPSSISIQEIETYKSFNLDPNSEGINPIQYRSGSLENDERTFTVSASYWNSLLVNFYLSGSHRTEDKFSFSKYSLGIHNDQNPQHRNKFHPSGSVLFIPQRYFGEGIKKESFTSPFLPSLPQNT